MSKAEDWSRIRKEDLEFALASRSVSAMVTGTSCVYTFEARLVDVE